jgi:hypothetical protein
MQAASVGLAWVWMMLAGGTGALSNMGAPLPLDPNLSAIAPGECLWYGTTSGLAAADPNSSNETEKLFAEPAVQRLLTSIEEQIMAAVRTASGEEGPEARVLAEKIPVVVKAFITRPIAAYVGNLDIQPNAPPTNVEAALVLNAGDQKADLEAALTTLLGMATQQGMQTTAESAGDVAWQRVTLPPDAPVVRYGWKDDYFIIAVGETTHTQLLERLGGATPDWLAKVRAENPIEREYSLGYVNVTAILQKVQPILEAEEPEAWPIIERLGLTHIQAIHGVTGYDEVGCTSMTHLVTDGQRPGLLAFIPHEPLTAEDLTPIPKDAMVAVAARFNPTEALEHALDLATQFEPSARDDFNREMQMGQAEVGVDLPKEIVGSIGDAWVAYLPAGDLMMSWTSAAAAVRVKDAATLRTAVAKIVAKAKEEAARSGERVAINESTTDGRTVYTVQFLGAPIPITPSWSISDKWMVFGLMPGAVHATLDRTAADSLSAAEPVAAVMSGGEGPAVLAYADTPQLVRAAYPWLQMGLQMLSAQLRNEGIVIDVSALPMADVIVKHLRPNVSTLTHEDDGFHFISRGSIPGGSNVASAPILGALLLPAVGSAREAARRNQELNNLRMLSLGALNNESARGEMLSDIYSEDGKPLLSWRVRILPFIEENALYQQFNLDEPWDSENNLRLLDAIPAAFRSPSAEYLGNRTRYVTLKSPDSLFPGQQAVRLAGVTDGTSNTLLVVQAAPEAAVEWSRPADIEFDAENPFAGVADPSGQFLAAFCDGSVRSLSLAIGDETMRALVTRAGEEVIDDQMLWQPPAPYLYDMQVQPAEAAPAVQPAGAGLDK